MATAKTFSFTCPGGCISASAKCSKRSAPWIFGLHLSILVGVVGKTNKAREVEFEYIAGVWT
jgi:hypothetical protein